VMVLVVMAWCLWYSTGSGNGSDGTGGDDVMLVV
jgi:hypothetical protein